MKCKVHAGCIFFPSNIGYYADCLPDSEPKTIQKGCFNKASYPWRYINYNQGVYGYKVLHCRMLNGLYGTAELHQQW